MRGSRQFGIDLIDVEIICAADLLPRARIETPLEPGIEALVDNPRRAIGIRARQGRCAKISSVEPFSATAFSRSWRCSVTLDAMTAVPEGIDGDLLDARGRLGGDDPRRAAERDRDDMVFVLRHREPGMVTVMAKDSPMKPIFWSRRKYARRRPIRYRERRPARRRAPARASLRTAPVAATRGCVVSSSRRPTGSGGAGRGVTCGGFVVSWNSPAELKFAVNVARSMTVVPRSSPAETSMNENGRYITPALTGDRTREGIPQRFLLVIARVEFELEGDALPRRVIFDAAEEARHWDRESNRV